MSSLIAPRDSYPIEDAENIKKACQGWGTDENAIISILAHRNAPQRKLIRLSYQEIYHEDLIKQLKSELSGNFERAICYWTMDPSERDAKLANEALNKATVDYKMIIEIACTRTSEELLAVRRSYRFLFKHSLEEDVALKTNGPIRNLLVAIVSTYRYEGNEWDKGAAQSEASVFHEQIGKKAFDHEEIIRILGTRSKAQLCAAFNYYKDLHGTSISKGLLIDPIDDYLVALRTVIRCIKYPQRYFAKVLRNAINNLGTEEDALSRVIITRAEKDLNEIMDLYSKRNNTTLANVVAQYTSGDYKTFLLALLGNI
ncbi:hypothetical protein L6164_037160 [Bauhinia variegata]|uniref:Uncharacterized protein n=1 Tax=Bauhinia variegata TaxID=167791 RepID=A0ACB9KJE4_BAUVA|nr:hypothetical protein L6164_037160 [Bauhinia variegata]